jgi:tetratricopeptide (TPR) repeat protein
MSDESELEGDEAAACTAATEGAAAGLALAAASREKADAFLDAQTAVARLQHEHLHEQRGLQISHLKWRRFNDWARAGWQVMLALLGALAVAAIATALWDASRADGLVVDAFTVPPDFAKLGLSGDVVADDVVERLGAIRKSAMTISYSITNDVSAERANEIKVDIPETGISVSDAWRYLRHWLGHERHLTGSIRGLEDGRIALALSLDGADAMTETGKLSDLPSLEAKAAEDVFAAFDTVNYINYLDSIGRRRDAMETAAQFVRVAEGQLHADSYNLWGYTTVYATGDIGLGLARVRIAMNIDPRLAVTHVMAARFDFFLGHDEDRLAEDRTVLSLRNEDQLPAHQHGGFEQMQQQASAQIALLQGDFANGRYWSCSHSCTWSGLLVTKAIMAARLHDIALARKRLGEGLAAGETTSTDVSEARFDIDSAEGNWSAAAADAEGISVYATLPGVSPKFIAITQATYAAPMLAVAQARAGRFAQALATIDTTPRDCVACETARGDIEALRKHWTGAAAWYANAVKLAPSIPFANAAWGAMLMRAGQYDAAVAQFREANVKGPHFADPLEMWGEALMLKNRSDLALAKFEEANKYAPNWGRLHLKWGEALAYTGHKDEALRQFAKAKSLDLSAADAATLPSWTPRHG